MLNVDAVLDHDKWLAQRFRYDNVLSRYDARLALEEAAGLVTDAFDEPAALFFVFVRRPEEVAGGWWELPAALAKTQARRLRQFVDADREDFRTLRFAVAMDRAPFEQVRAWFRERMKPLDDVS